MHKIEPGRSTYLAGPIEWGDLVEVSMRMKIWVQENPRAWVNLYITSPGGEVGAGFALYDFITVIVKPKLQTIIIREVDSMAIIVALAGNFRVMSHSATMFFHDIGSSLEREVRVPRHQLKRMGESLDDLLETYVQIIVSRSKLTSREIKRLIEREQKMNASEALKLGLVHEII